MTAEIGLLLVIVVVTMVAFSLELLEAEVVGMASLLALTVFGLISPEAAFASGFGSETFVLILCVLILAASLAQTGVVDIVGRQVLRFSTSERLLPSVVMGAGATVSSVMSNTAATAFLLPVVFGIARRTGVSASRLLMPLAFAGILASSVTLVATSTNLVVSGLMSQNGLSPISMFELTPVGLPIVIVGLVYLALAGPRLIPDRAGSGALDQFGIRPYLAEIRIQEESPFIGQTLEETRLTSDYELTVLRLLRGGTISLSPSSQTTLAEGDVLLVNGVPDQILAIREHLGEEAATAPDGLTSGEEPREDDVLIVEAILMTDSSLIGRTLQGARVAERFGIQVLALQHREDTLYRRYTLTPLRLGDVLLVQGRRERLQTLDAARLFRILTTVDAPRIDLRRAARSVGIFLLALALATAGVVSLPVATLGGAVALFVTRCITPSEAFAQVEWRVLILIGCMLALGAAMQETGTDFYLAELIVRHLGDAGAVPLLAGFFVLTMLLTQPMSNQAAAAVTVPIAIQTALQLGLDPRPFGITIAVAASTSFLTPLEPACLLVYGPGRYRVIDFLRVGGPLSLAILALTLLLVPLIWPLTPAT